MPAYPLGICCLAPFLSLSIQADGRAALLFRKRNLSFFDCSVPDQKTVITLEKHIGHNGVKAHIMQRTLIKKCKKTPNVQLTTKLQLELEEVKPTIA